eukprot:514401-Prymnesium_polylepis.1
MAARRHLDGMCVRFSDSALWRGGWCGGARGLVCRDVAGVELSVVKENASAVGGVPESPETKKLLRFGVRACHDSRVSRLD